VEKDVRLKETSLARQRYCWRARLVVFSKVRCLSLQLFARSLCRCVLYLGTNPDRLDVDKFPDAERGEFAPIATTLDSAERKARVRGRHTVNEDPASLDTRCQLTG